MHHSSTWTDDQVQKLRKLHAEGLAFSLIGAHLGITRNAAIGKAQRLGLDQRPHVSNTPIRSLSREEQAARADRVRFVRLNAERARRARASGLPAPAETSPVPAPAPLECRPCSLLELTRNTCSFPIGDPGEPGFHFCGAKPLGSLPYCFHHDKITHTAAPKRTRPFIQPRWNAA